MSVVDVLVLTALQDELTALLTLGGEWTEARDLGGFPYFHISLTNRNNEPFTIAAAWIGEMGERSAAVRGQQLLSELSPTCLAMCGVCAGYREKVSLGDVIVADQIWNYEDGKRSNNEFAHATRTFDMQSTWKMDAAFLAKELDLHALSASRPPTKAAQERWFLHTLVAHETEGTPAPAEHPHQHEECPNWTSIVRDLQTQALITRKGRSFISTEKGRDFVDEDFANHPKGHPPEPPMRVHVGAIATGSAVVEEKGIFERLRKIVRTTIGMDMEGAALGELAARFQKHSILVKAVQDFADHEKDDGFRAFACKASATFLITFLQKHFEPPKPVKVDDAQQEQYLFGDNQEQEGHFLRRVENLVHLRFQGAKIKRKTAVSPFAGLFEIATDARGFSRISLVAGLDAPMTHELATRFTAEVEAPYRSRYPYLQTTLVHQGEEAPVDLRERMDRRGITLQTFDQYQGLFDLTAYLEWQTRELEKNPRYLSSTYVPQSAWIKLAGHLDMERTENAMSSIWELLKTPSVRRFLLVLGEFGTGKTFLMRELCRHMVKANHPVWPVLLDMSKLEKQHDLAELLAAHFARCEVPGYNFKAFQYLLSEGKIALFFDGFDELADRATYENAKEHFHTVISATQGNAKVILSSRRQHFLTDGEIHQAVELEFAKNAASAVQAGYRLFLLAPFHEAQIRQYLRNVLKDEAAAEARYRLIDEVKDLLGLSHNPRMLAFIADIDEEKLRAAKEERGEITSAGLYEILVKQWLDFEHQRSIKRGAAKGISREALDCGMTALALSMWHSRANVVETNEIREVIGQAMVTLGEPTLDFGMMTHLFGSGSLLVRDADGHFSFIHRSVLEWLVAREAALSLMRGQEATMLVVEEMGALMTDFFTSMVGRARAANWARRVMADAAEPVAVKNAALVLRRMGEHFELVNFEGQDLRGKNYADVDWAGANLRHADLRGAMVRGANLRRASLAGADLSRADLSHVCLVGADLSSTDFSFARLESADLSEAKPFHADRFRGANLLAAKGIPDEQHAALLAEGAAPPILHSIEAVAPAASPCYAVAFSPDGSQLAAGFEDGAVWLLDRTGGKVLRVLSGHKSWVLSVVFSPDGKTLASGSYDKTVRLWDVATGHLISTLEGHSDWVMSVVFAADGKRLVSSSYDATLRLWDVSMGQVLRIFEGHTNSIWSVVFSPDGKTLASGSDDTTLRLWDAATGRCLAVLEGHTDSVLSVAFSPDGKTLASGSSDKSVLLWDLQTGAPLRAFEGHTYSVLSVAFAPDGQSIASGSYDNTIRLWDVSVGDTLRVFEGHTNWVRSVVFAPDGKALASGSSDKTVRLWDITTGRVVRVFEGHAKMWKSVVFAPAEPMFACGSSDKTLSLWSGASGGLLCTLEGHTNWVVSVAFSPSGTLVCSGSSDKTVRVWDISTERTVRVFEGHTNWVTNVAFSPDGKTIASGSYDKAVFLWNLTTGRIWRELTGHSNWVTSVAFSPNGKTIASGSYDNTIRVWSFSSGRVLRQFTGHTNAVMCVMFSPDGKTLASGSSDHTVRLWNTSTGGLLRVLDGHSNPVLGVVFSPDGKLLASSSEDNTVRLWDVATGSLLRVLEGHTNAVPGVSFSPDATLLVSGSDDSTLRLWDVSTGKNLAILLRAKNGWVAFTPDGRYKYGGEISGAFWHIVGLCRFEPGELDLLLPDTADIKNLPPTPTTIRPWPRPTS